MIDQATKCSKAITFKTSSAVPSAKGTFGQDAKNVTFAKTKDSSSQNEVDDTLVYAVKQDSYNTADFTRRDYSSGTKKERAAALALANQQSELINVGVLDLTSTD